MRLTESSGSSPHTRGAHLRRQKDSAAPRIIPAYAGSTQPRMSGRSNRRDHPRIRGEHSVSFLGGVVAGGSSPHTRGARLHQARPRGPGRIIPAYAGSTRAAAGTGIARWDHPRIRGEHTNDAQMKAFSAGSSPHTRGARYHHRHRRPAVGIIPAYAGSTVSLGGSAWEAADHPRIRGEHLIGVVAANVEAGSSPHTRGAPPTPSGTTPVGRIIPAYAGSTAARASSAGRAWDHPRIRGEHRPHLAEGHGFGGSSPHTRGARRFRRRSARTGGIIPAYAGSTAQRIAVDGAPADHPRIRGEHEPIPAPKGDTMGSSPHTRGARGRREP